MGDLKGQVAVVTGASRGIGKTIAVDLAREGCNMVLTARSEAKLQEVAEECRELGAEVLVVGADMVDPESPQMVVDVTMEHFGRLDILINNAGMWSLGPADSADLDSWELLMSVNLHAVMRMTRLALPHIMGAPAGSRKVLVFMSSMAGRFTFKGGAAYVASKHALMGFAGSVFDDVRESGVKVSSICPGFVKTDMTAGQPMDPDKMIQVDAVSEAVLFVIGFPGSGCPTEIIIRPQYSPMLKRR